MTVSYVLATANTAESTLYGDVSHSTKLDTSHAAVIALVATGTFDGSDEKTPPGVAPTPGKYLTRIVNLESGAVLDWGLSNQAPTLSLLGDPVNALK